MMRRFTKAFCPLTVNRGHFVAGDISKAKSRKDHFGGARRVDAGVNIKWDLLLPPPDIDDLQLTEDTVRL